MAYENYTVKQFAAAWFEKDYSGIPEEEFETVYSEYVDTAGLFNSDEFDKIVYITFLNSRVNSIAMGITLHRDFINFFDVPYAVGFDFFQKYGHNLIWKNDKENFLSQLTLIENKEKKYISKLEGAIKELNDLREKKGKLNVDQDEETKNKKARAGFIRTINSLGKIGYKIEKNETTVEELAYMIKQQLEEVEEIKNRK